jgi:hypothetical protein
VDFVFKTLTDHHAEAAAELAEHLDCKNDTTALRLLDEMLEYNVLLVRALNDWCREKS